jgi:hypothetical protein
MATELADFAQDSADYKDILQEFLRVGNLTLIPIWLQKLREGGKVEDLRKAIEFMTSATAAAIEKKADPNANLPVFNFTFVNGGVQATQMVEGVPRAPEATQVVEVVAQLPRTELIQELDIQLSAPPQVTPEELAALRAELDDMLGDLAC